MVELRNVSVTYSNGVDALNDVDIRIKDGEFVFVVGKSGAGKSTFIRLLLKEIEPTKGKILVNGFNLTRMKKRNAYRLRRTIGCVFQDFKLIESMNVYDNIAFVLRCIDASNKYIRNRVPYVIDLVGLKDKAYCKPSELSGGEKQRAAIARACERSPAYYRGRAYRKSRPRIEARYRRAFAGYQRLRDDRYNGHSRA